MTEFICGLYADPLSAREVLLLRETGVVFNSKFLFKSWGCLSTIVIGSSGMLIVPIKSRSLFSVGFFCTLGVEFLIKQQWLQFEQTILIS